MATAPLDGVRPSSAVVGSRLLTAAFSSSIEVGCDHSLDLAIRIPDLSTWSQMRRISRRSERSRPEAENPHRAIMPLSTAMASPRPGRHHKTEGIG